VVVIIEIVNALNNSITNTVARGIHFRIIFIGAVVIKVLLRTCLKVSQVRRLGY
jgi:hypothetical protein